MSMFTFRTNFFSEIANVVTGVYRSPSRLDLPPVQVVDIEETPEKRARTLKHLIKANHINNSIIYNNLQFHNHVPHILGSAYFLGADAQKLIALYESESDHLEPWVDAPSEISTHDWRDFLGRREYQRAWIDFLEDQVVQHGYAWRQVVDEYLYAGREPLVNNLICGLAHPLIHLGFAMELNSPTVAIEAVGLAACFYDDQHVYLDDPKYTTPSPWSSHLLLDVLARLHDDPRLDASFVGGTEDNFGHLTADKAREAIFIEYWNSWTIPDPTAQLEAVQRAAVALVVSTPAEGKKFGFIPVHALTASHAVRMIAPSIRPSYHVSLLRQWWLFALAAYIGAGRPEVHVEKIEAVDLQGRGWTWVEERAVDGEYASDAHFVKACRTIKEAATTWGDKDEYFLKAAVKFVDEFDGWSIY